MDGDLEETSYGTLADPKISYQVRQVLVLGHRYTHQMGRSMIEPQQYLMGLVRLDDSNCARILREIGIQINSVRASLFDQSLFIRNDYPGKVILAQSREAKELLRSAITYAVSRDRLVCTDHLLLAATMPQHRYTHEALSVHGIVPEVVEKAIATLQLPTELEGSPRDPSH